MAVNELASPLDWLAESGIKQDLTIAQLRRLESLEAELADWIKDGDRKGAAYYRDLKRLATPKFGMYDTGPNAEQEIVYQVAVQFICGWHDLNFRDVAHSGHGHLLHRGDRGLGANWPPRGISDGALVALAMTEPVGGSNVRKIRTLLRPGNGGGYVLTGSKRSISRIMEADLFVVYCVSADAKSQLIVISGESAHIRRSPKTPLGLNGWSWGDIFFEDVSVAEADLVTIGGGALALLERHFAYYRPLIAATVTGATARCVTEAAASQRSHLNEGRYARLWDTATAALAEGYTDVVASIRLSTHAAARGHLAPHSSRVLANMSKVRAVDCAVRTISQMTALSGAPTFDEESTIGRHARDILGFRFADGTHDALASSAGFEMVAGPARHNSAHRISTATTA